MNNVYLAGGNSLQLGNSVSAPRTQYPPSKKKKDKLKVEKFLARKKAEATAEVQQQVQPVLKEPEQVVMIPEQPAVSFPEAGVAMVRKKSFVSYDIERSSGADDSEIINLSYASLTESEQFFIKPIGGIDLVASDKSSKIRVHGAKMFQGSKEVAHVTLKHACNKFIEFVAKIGSISGDKPVLVCHGNDMWTLMNNMAYVGLDEELLSTIGGSMNFLDVVKEEENLMGKSKSLTSLSVSENLSEIILGNHMRSEITQHAHDAEFDANLLLKVMKKFLDNKSESDYDYILKNFVKLPNDLASSCKLAIQMIGIRRLRKKPKVNHFNIKYINGWGR